MAWPKFTSNIDPTSTGAADTALSLSFHSTSPLPTDINMENLELLPQLQCFQPMDSTYGNQILNTEYSSGQTRSSSSQASAIDTSSSSFTPKATNSSQSQPGRYSDHHKYVFPPTWQPSPPLYPVGSNKESRPRCFEHGCGGRTFSCAENYRRHVRERNGSSNATCPYCYMSFSRKSNRETHLSSGRCKLLKAWLSEPTLGTITEPHIDIGGTTAAWSL